MNDGEIQPPSNPEAEQALLGAILVNNEAYRRVAEFLEPKHFAEPVHGRIYSAIRTLIEGSQIANPVTLKNLFDQDGALTEIGGAQYLARLAASVVTIINSVHYAYTIVDCYHRRALIETGTKMIEQARTFDIDVPARAIAGEAERELSEILARRTGERGLTPAAEIGKTHLEAVDAAYRAGGRLTGLSTGLVDLNRILGGLQPELTVLAGRPSQGKSLLGGVIADNVARAGVGVAIYSLEQRRALWYARWLARRTRISTDRQNRGDLTASNWQQFVEASMDVDKLPIFVDETARLTVLGMRERTRRLMRDLPIGLMIVDHIGHVAASEAAQDAGDTAKITEITGDLLAATKDLGIPIIAISQLSRAVEARDSKRPQLADLRQSGSIEQDAHAVVFVYRRSYYLERESPERGSKESADKFLKRQEQHDNELAATRNIVELIVDKNRGGGIGTVKAYYNGETATVSDLSSRDDDGR